MSLEDKKSPQLEHNTLRAQTAVQFVFPRRAFVSRAAIVSIHAKVVSSTSVCCNDIIFTYLPVILTPQIMPVPCTTRLFTHTLTSSSRENSCS